MCSNQDALDYPNEKTKQVVEEIIKTQKITKYNVNIAVATAKGDNYAGIIHRATISGHKEDGEKTTLKLILKTPPLFGRDKFPIDKIYKREYQCYTELLPTLDGLQKKFDIPEEDRFRYIKFYGGDITDYQEILVLEDMNELGFKMANRQKSLDSDQMVLLMREFGALHATSFALKKSNKELFDEFCKETITPDDFPEMFESGMIMSKDTAVEAMDDPICKERLMGFGEIMLEKFKKYVSQEEYVPYTVLCHGDGWTNNMLFRYENDKPVEVRLLDWQMVKHASPIVDIAYLIFTSTDEELRAKHYENLLDIYYEALKKNLTKLECDINVCYPESIFREHIKLIMPFGLIMAFMTAPMFMSEDDDIKDMAELLKKDTFDKDDMALKNVKSQDRYEQRMRGIVRDFVRLDLI